LIEDYNASAPADETEGETRKLLQTARPAYMAQQALQARS
jgi:hypothetical protein